MLPRPARLPLFPYTTLFRSKFVAGAIAECGEKKIPGAVLIPSGFAEVGNVAGQQEIVEVGRKYGVRLMGPNIYGFYYTWRDRKSTRLNSSHLGISYAVFCLK